MNRREGVAASFSPCLSSLNSRIAPMLLAVHEPSWPWSYTDGICSRRLTSRGSVFNGSTAMRKSRMSGWSFRQPYRFCVRTARPVGASVITAVSLTTRSFLCGFSLFRWLLRSRQDRGEGVLGPALAEPGEEGDDEQGQPLGVPVRAGRDGKVEQAAVDGERDRHPEGASDQRP